MTVLVTGAAGFIGFHVAASLLEAGEHVIGLDNLNAYYDVGLKQARLGLLQGRPGFVFHRADIGDAETIDEIFATHPDIGTIIHLAAQAGVRYSLIDPLAYVHSNLKGHVVLLEAARRLDHLSHFVYASSSSVYGANTIRPYAVEQRTDHPVSLYGASKKSMEMISESYAAMHGLRLTGLRFFTVYGPWGRPDMALFIFTRKMLADEPLPIFADGRLRRDFTYIDDIVAGVVACAENRTAAGSGTRHRLFNLGNTQPVSVLRLVELLEASLGCRARVEFQPMQPGDVTETHADIEASRAAFGFAPKTRLEEGVPRFVEWYLAHYGKSAAPGEAARPS